MLVVKGRREEKCYGWKILKTERGDEGGREGGKGEAGKSRMREGIGRRLRKGRGRGKVNEKGSCVEKGGRKMKERGAEWENEVRGKGKEEEEEEEERLSKEANWE